MKKNRKVLTDTSFLLLGLFIILSNIAFGQTDTQTKVQSLYSRLKQTLHDTDRVSAFNDLAWEYQLLGQSDSSLYYSNKVLEQVNLITTSKEFTLQAQNAKLISSFSKSKASAYNNIGLVYDDKGEFPKAMEFFLKALKINEETGDKKRTAGVLSNIGNIYKTQHDFPKALSYFFKALKINEEIGNKNWEAANLNNIGIVYMSEEDYFKALSSFLKALEIAKELGNKYGISITQSNIGKIYNHQGDSAFSMGNLSFAKTEKYPKAMEFYFSSLKISEEIGDKHGIAINLGHIGSLYRKQEKYQDAEKYLLQSLALCKELGTLNYLRQIEESLSKLYYEKGEYKKAYEHLQQYGIAMDSLFSIEKEQDITRKEMNYEYEKKEQAAKLEQEKKVALHQAELKQQTLQRNSFIVGFALMLMLAGVSYRSYRNKRKAFEKIAEQKKLVEEKNKEILDSITYAKRIQTAILPPQKLVKEYLQQSFILYKPKDIVAGDFYWLENVGDKILFAAADCTGHGVPGAMVSVVCNNGLNRSVREFGLLDPGKILDKTREIVIGEFEKSEDEVKDGMDISLCALNTSTGNLTWAGANNPLWIIRKNATEIEEFKADKQPIGKLHQMNSFTTHALNLNSGDSIYIFTDGYADQFGGEKGKKLKSSGLKGLLLSIANKPMQEQKEIIDQTFETWKGNLEQIDDVCVIGVRIN